MIGMAEENGIISVNIDGNPILFDVPPQLIDSRTMVPLRAIFEALGAVVSWDNSSQTITATKENIIVKMQTEQRIKWKILTTKYFMDYY